jgi:hypothetical protein
MTHMKDEALELAFYLASMHHTDDGYPELRQKVRGAIRQAFEAHVQEPVAFDYFKDWMVKEMPPLTTIGNPEWWAKRIYDRFIYVTPPATQPAPVQEPVAWMDADGDVYKSEPHKNWCPPHAPLYTTPPAAQRQWVGLTDEQKLMCWARATHDADVEHKTEHQCLMDYGTEIEAKLKEKNT